MYLFVLEFLGTNELIVILVVALILLGPRRLPQMSRKLGKSLTDFKRVSEDFKRTWEREVEMESADKDARIERALPSAEDSILGPTVERGGASSNSSESYVNSISQQNPAGDNEDSADILPGPSVTPADPATMQPAATAAAGDAPTPTVTAPQRKRDWL